MLIYNRNNAKILNTPQGSEIRPLMDRTVGAITQCSLAEETLPPGKTVPSHHHEVLEEIYYIVSGCGVMTIGEESQAVGAGDAIFIPKNNIHTLTNTGDEDMKILLVCGPAFYFEDHIFESAGTSAK